MNPPALSVVYQLENLLASDGSLYFEEQPPSGAWEQSYLAFPESLGQCTAGICNCKEPLHAWKWKINSIPCLEMEFKDFEDICGDFGWHSPPDVKEPFFEGDVNVVDAKPLNAAGEIRDQALLENGETVFGEASGGNAVCSRSSEPLVSDDGLVSGRYKSSALEVDEIQKYFDVPITKAAKELKVGLTVLKKRCRELNIRRWPHRKIKSLKSLIDSAKELGLTSEIEMLEEHKRMLKVLPEMELTERTKKLRQACFKANYKKRRAMAAAAAAMA
ncbi:protein RKD3-like [Coffea arabica]|uniref:Protein RKD3-like n=1 Tax=Coffea arabica TaxID=13443 RepID=A0ABM4WNS7_COFAR